MRDLVFSHAARDAKADALCSLLDGGTLELYDGRKPETPDEPVDEQTLLARLHFSVPAFQPAIEGVADARVLVPETHAPAGGTPTWFRASTRSGDPLFDGSVGQCMAGIGEVPRQDWASEVQFDLYIDGDVQEGGEVMIASLVYRELAA